MAKLVNRYNVYDTVEDKYVMKEAKNEEVSVFLSVSVPTVSKYAKEKILVKGRYLITLIKVEENYCIPQEVLQGWEEMRKAATLLKSGKGEIVEESGRKYVEKI